MVEKNIQQNKGNKDWFKVDTEGFKTQMMQIGIARLICEIISKSFDEDSVKNIKVEIEKHGNVFHVKVNDDGNGFRNLKEIYTLYADSYKRADPTKRGRFNLGEKQFIALCLDAYIKTGKVNVVFKGKRREIKRLSKKFEGTEVFGRIKPEIETSKDEVMNFLERIAVPSDKKLFVNGVEKLPTEIVKSFNAKLKTPIASKGKYQRLVNRERDTEVQLIDLSSDEEQGWLYEKGIPICPLVDNIRWHINVQQKVPQVMERNVVNAGYLKSVYSAVAENCVDMITDEDAGQSWVSDALESTSGDTSRKLLEKRYGNENVIISGTDYRANERAIELGSHLIGGNELSKDIKANLLSNGVLDYASKKFGTNEIEIAESVEENSSMRFFAEICKEVARDSLKKEISVRFVTTKHTNELASYGGSALYWNVGKLGGKSVFDNPSSPYLLGILIHELAHDKFGNNDGFAHLSHEYLHEQERVAGICFSKGIGHYIEICKRGKILA